MKDQIELSIDLAAMTMIFEMYPSAVDPAKICAIHKVITSHCTNQPSAEMLINYLAEKYK